MAYFFLSTWVKTRACVSAVCDTRSCRTVVCPLGYPTIVSQTRTRPRHTGVWSGRVGKLVAMPYFSTALTHERV
ncbi:Ribosome maturation factor RimP [Gossypium arboreum]|uniref:Ribosome maturation factor RimP n=1 Tax=Gossypium arboreum TaxID=29729 RepID=A0A0B0NP79_GOSAR|nr:Ribosome maturation factor RimP [Gossypium arboreum]